VLGPSSNLHEGILAHSRQGEAGWRWNAWDLAERAAAVPLLVLAAPLLGILILAIAAISRRSPLVAHRRAGWRGGDLWMLKLRTLWDASAPSGERRLVVPVTDSWVPADKSAGDPRVTHPLARWIRRYSLDELPQLLHVIRGEMALSGPRPLTWQELREHYGEAMAQVLTVRPGITGLWQVRGRSRLTYRQRRRLDLFLVSKRSLWLRGWILAVTLSVVMRGENAG
jgi:lipopolysaccharide/colanic/teichoic acid biosynthesis glycosyltransferase